MEKKMNIPGYVQEITEKLEEAGFAAYIVGGCVRDLLLEKEVEDWDVTTKARFFFYFPFGSLKNGFPKF